MSAPAVQRARDVLRACRDLGFAAAGIANLDPWPTADAFRNWITAGKHGEMSYLADSLETRLQPGALLRGAKAAIIVADQYALRGDSTPHALPPGHGRIARYARGRDYHRIIKDRLRKLIAALRGSEPAARFRPFVDLMPFHEREAAARAGLGWIGKHTLLIHPRLGSWLLLGGVLTTMDLQAPPEQQPIDDHCGACTRCIDACPTRAISPYSVDASRCISYLTIERRGEIPQEFHAAIGDRLFGCDICQEVCPHNGPARRETAPPHPAYRPARPSLPLADLLTWNDADRDRELRGTAIRRAFAEMLRRNALIVLANRPESRTDAALLAQMRDLAGHDESPIVRATARRALAALEQTPAPR